MSRQPTIWDAAVKALESLGGSGSLTEIFSKIIENDLYEFGTANPADAPHVLDTEIKRKCRNSNRNDHTGSPLFEQIKGGYRLLSESEIQKTVKASGSKRVHRAKDKEDLIGALMSDKVGIFKEIWRLLLFAAQIGVRERKRIPLGAIDSGKGIDQSTFGNCPSWPGVCYLMTLVEENSSDALSGSADAEDRRIVVFQEYANGGLAILQEHFQDRNIDLDAVITFVSDRTKEGGQEIDLDLSI
ncbi:MAG: DNA phosphorothioation-associated protein 4 [Verrucomicrobiae bacterium]|nr:DNA phosphorothioation-associated protein 4 [Verrucomicrobiae bacterium]